MVKTTKRNEVQTGKSQCYARSSVGKAMSSCGCGSTEVKRLLPRPLSLPPTKSFCLLRELCISVPKIQEKSAASVESGNLTQRVAAISVLALGRLSCSRSHVHLSSFDRIVIHCTRSKSTLLCESKRWKWVSGSLPLTH